jgi:hypothetical protein
MTTTTHWFVRSAENQGGLAESKTASEHQRFAHSRSSWDRTTPSNWSASEAVVRRRIRLATTIAVLLLSLGLWAAILWALTALISVVLR